MSQNKFGISEEGRRKDRIFWPRKKTQTQAALNSELLNVRDQADKERESNHGLDPAFTFGWKITAMVGRQISFQCISQRNDLQMPPLLKQHSVVLAATQIV